MRKPALCICENKDADQLRGNREADQRLCFRYTDSTIPLLFKSEISSLLPSSVAAQSGLCGTWSETPKTGFLRTRLICKQGVATNKDTDRRDLVRAFAVLALPRHNNNSSSFYMRPSLGFWGTGEQGHLFQGNRGTKANF